jgi:DNA-binding NarL/FixJ family response regulator
MPAPISLLVAHSKDLIRAGLRSMLAGSPVKILGEASDASSTLTLAKKHKPAVLLLDAAIPGGDAFELAGRLLELRRAGDAQRGLGRGSDGRGGESPPQLGS